MNKSDYVLNKLLESNMSDEQVKGILQSNDVQKVIKGETGMSNEQARGILQNSTIQKIVREEPSRSNIYPNNIIMSMLAGTAGALASRSNLNLLRGTAAGAAVGLLISELQYLISKGLYNKANELLEKAKTQLGE